MMFPDSSRIRGQPAMADGATRARAGDEDSLWPLGVAGWASSTGRGLYTALHRSPPPPPGADVAAGARDGSGS